MIKGIFAAEQTRNVEQLQARIRVRGPSVPKTQSIDKFRIDGF